MTTLGRYDRHVLYARMRLGSDAPRHTLAFQMEEALRLCSLPGETEGRVYYFRHLHLVLPGSADRVVWQAAFQDALLELSRSAVHGHHPAAQTADAIFFLNQQDAAESLLAVILQQQSVDAWFWPAVSGTRPGATPPMQVAALIENLSRSEAAWMAVAAAVFAIVIAVGDPFPLLDLLSGAVVRQWLRELGSDASPHLAPQPLRLNNQTRNTLERAVHSLGRDDPRVLWLASLAVLLACPSEMTSGTAVSHARLILQPPARGHARPDTPQSLGPFPATEPAVHREAPSDSLVPDVPCVGEATAGAGLYFLLNALHYLKIFDYNLGLPFLAHLFQHVARQSGIEPGDPILLWTYVTLEAHGPSAIDLRLLRIWTWKMRRWCWRNAKLRITEIVRRTGVVTLTRTDLDVSLPLDSADLRIRRIGLDLDPGWLPWFGRVVRFHYRNRGEFS